MFGKLKILNKFIDNMCLRFELLWIYCDKFRVLMLNWSDFDCSKWYMDKLLIGYEILDRRMVRLRDKGIDI